MHTNTTNALAATTTIAITMLSGIASAEIQACLYHGYWQTGEEFGGRVEQLELLVVKHIKVEECRLFIIRLASRLHCEIIVERAEPQKH